MLRTYLCTYALFAVAGTSLLAQEGTLAPVEVGSAFQTESAPRLEKDVSSSHHRSLKDSGRVADIAPRSRAADLARVRFTAPHVAMQRFLESTAEEGETYVSASTGEEEEEGLSRYYQTRQRFVGIRGGKSELFRAEFRGTVNREDYAQESIRLRLVGEGVWDDILFRAGTYHGPQQGIVTQPFPEIGTNFVGELLFELKCDVDGRIWADFVDLTITDPNTGAKMHESSMGGDERGSTDEGKDLALEDLDDEDNHGKLETECVESSSRETPTYFTDRETEKELIEQYLREAARDGRTVDGDRVTGSEAAAVAAEEIMAPGAPLPPVPELDEESDVAEAGPGDDERQARANVAGRSRDVSQVDPQDLRLVTTDYAFAGGTITGMVTTTEGEPVSGATVQVAQGSTIGGTVTSVEVESDAEGRFETAVSSASANRADGSLKVALAGLGGAVTTRIVSNLVDAPVGTEPPELIEAGSKIHVAGDYPAVALESPEGEPLMESPEGKPVTESPQGEPAVDAPEGAPVVEPPEGRIAAGTGPASLSVAQAFGPGGEPVITAFQLPVTLRPGRRLLLLKDPEGQVKSYETGIYRLKGSIERERLSRGQNANYQFDGDLGPGPHRVVYMKITTTGPITTKAEGKLHKIKVGEDGKFQFKSKVKALQGNPAGVPFNIKATLESAEGGAGTQ